MTNLHHAIDYVELGVGDLAATKAFYERAFGWRFHDYGPEYAGIAAPDGDGEVGETASPARFARGLSVVDFIATA